MKYTKGKCPVCGDDGTEVNGEPRGLEYYKRVAIYDQDTGDELHSEADLCYCGNCGSWVPPQSVVAVPNELEQEQKDAEKRANVSLDATKADSLLNFDGLGEQLRKLG